MARSRFKAKIRRLKGVVLALAGLTAIGTPAAPARAAEATKKSTEVYVDLQPVGLPVVQDHKLVNYVFVTFRLMLAPGADPNKVYEHEPFIRDKLIRIASQAPFLLPHQTSHLDDARLKATTLNLSRDALGAGAVRSVVISTETAQH